MSYGCCIKYPRGKQFWSILADLSNIRIGDKIFFYQRRIDENQEGRGFIGVFRSTSLAFEDNADISYNGNFIYGECPSCHRKTISKIENNSIKCSNCRGSINGYILPLRITIKVDRFYERYLDDNRAYIDITDRGRLSTLLFRKIYGKGRERSCSPILPEEAEKLERLLERCENQQINNRVFEEYQPDPYVPTNFIFISNYLNQIQFNQNGELRYEFMLEFYIMQLLNWGDQIVQSIFRPFCEIEWFGNQILFGIGGDKTDLLVLYKRNDMRYRADVVELKKGSIRPNDLEEIMKYIYWISQLVTSNIQDRIENPFYLKPILIGRSVNSIQKIRRIWTDIRKRPFTVIPYNNPLEIHLLDLEIWNYDFSSRQIFFSRII